MGLQGQIYKLLYLSQKWFDCHETKRKHIDWTLGLKWDHRVWPWPWPDLEFSRSNMEFAISQLKMVWVPRNEKQTYWLNPRPQIWQWPWKVRCEDLTDSDHGDFKCRRAVASSCSNGHLDSSACAFRLFRWQVQHGVHRTYTKQNKYNLTLVLN